MKKLIFPLAVIAISLTACKKETKAEDSKPATEEVASDKPATEEVPASTESASSDLPKFSSPEVQKFAEEYSAYVNESIEASKSGDAAKVQALSAKAQEWATKTQEATAKMTPEDVKLWTDYYTKLSQKMMNP
ncbi:hypothetical protein [Chryseobacterium terrae]|uniref:Uncharacterized protein n=1 Tax=Chryseobacterium terrae TaxID=3163299 RepID=A0ABW8Y671_9FLAO